MAYVSRPCPSPLKFEYNTKVTFLFDSPHLTSLATVISLLWSAVHELAILSAWVALAFSLYVFISPFSMGWHSIFPLYRALNMGIINESPTNDTLLHYVSWFFDISLFNFSVAYPRRYMSRWAMELLISLLCLLFGSGREPSIRGWYPVPYFWFSLSFLRH